MGRGANLEEEVELFMAAREKVDASAKIGEKRARGGYTGSCTNLCTVDRVKKPVSGVRILQDKFPTSLLDSVWNLCKMAVEGQVPDKLGGFSVWNLCNWQSKVSKVGFRPLVMNHFPTKSATLKFLTRMAGSGTEFQHQTSEVLHLTCKISEEGYSLNTIIHLTPGQVQIYGTLFPLKAYVVTEHSAYTYSFYSICEHLKRKNRTHLAFSLIRPVNYMYGGKQR
uniref:Uncharacterized protein n=1 Tax=Populus alba TaxID=43335 RepID=A0A4U5LVF4_POPAL|nr:hypothetical protein D5086_0000324550 [Populus alba]